MYSSIKKRKRIKKSIRLYNRISKSSVYPTLICMYRQHKNFKEIPPSLLGPLSFRLQRCVDHTIAFSADPRTLAFVDLLTGTFEVSPGSMLGMLTMRMRLGFRARPVSGGRRGSDASKRSPRRTSGDRKLIHHVISDVSIRGAAAVAAVPSLLSKRNSVGF